MASNGLRTFSYDTVYGQRQIEGFIIIKIQGLMHVSTDYGVYEVDNEFVHTHNCLMTVEVKYKTIQSNPD